MLRCVALASDVAKSYPGYIKSQGTEQDGASSPTTRPC
jgi:hypothetical protein